jgi:hypothetical protein
MKCKQCGEEFPNLNALTKHKETCSGKENEPVSNDFIIPKELLPEEYKLYATGQSVGLRVTGKHTPEGVIVQEVTLIR